MAAVVLLVTAGADRVLADRGLPAIWRCPARRLLAPLSAGGAEGLLAADVPPAVVVAGLAAVLEAPIDGRRLAMPALLPTDPASTALAPTAMLLASLASTALLPTALPATALLLATLALARSTAGPPSLLGVHVLGRLLEQSASVRLAR